MENQQKSIRDMLAEIFSVGNINQVIAFGKDGFVIDSLGTGRSEDVEYMGVMLAKAFNEMDKLGRMTNSGDLDNITITFKKSVIIAMATANAMITVNSSDTSALGFLRVKMNALMPIFEQNL